MEVNGDWYMVNSHLLTMNNELRTKNYCQLSTGNWKLFLKKQSQFYGCTNGHNLLLTKDYERRTTNNELIKTKPTCSELVEPIKANFTASKKLTKVVLFNGLYKTANERYYIRHKCRCSSMVEHSFRKAGVEGSTPSIGFYI